jgi:aminoglycoside phosphotransferase (APT) family kinase protein
VSADVRGAVEAALGRAVGEVAPLGGGASARMWRVVVDGQDAVLRCPRVDPGGMAIGAEAEARVLRAVVGAGVPAPTVLAEVPARDGLDAGYLMTRLEGEALPGRLLRDPAYDAARAGLVTEAAAALAGIHAVQCDPGLPRLGATDQLDLLEGVHRSFGVPVPAFELALRWLRAHLPAPVDPALVHGDFRLGNLLVAQDGLVAVLDWELAHRGDPAEDLGWLCARPWRFGGPGEAAGLGSRADLLAAYSSAGGAPVDPDRLHFWEVLASLKWGVICQVQAARHSREHPSLEHAVIGRRVTESELDLLVLLEEAA